MSHHIYKTDALVLGSRNIGESNKLFFLFTRELGFIVATAQGVREIKSKLKYGLQDYSMSKVDFVRGKEIWRITNAIFVNGRESLRGNEKREFLARVFLFLRRMLHGEDKNVDLYNSIAGMMEFLSSKQCDVDNIHELEMFIDLKILYYLGYVGETENFSEILHEPVSADVLEKVKKIKQAIIREINRGIEESGL